ncbi:hypothetical protein HII31_09070 [Pseudocercospora fuligena]|uniref:Uncharacterized protein n=1 Tax=Pseudocercospora fuligena TaxID=685502 RepID=A0A8H6REH1_9PEZI|nr:hypothetical protein HII31_09070 [Pseudocercospora fuligena]
MATSAAHRVFGTTEILEQILLHLLKNTRFPDDCFRKPIKDTRWALLTIQRTCRTFHDTIVGSIALRRGLMLEHPATFKPPSRGLIPTSLEWLNFHITPKARFMLHHHNGERISFFITADEQLDRAGHMRASWRRIYVFPTTNTILTTIIVRAKGPDGFQTGSIDGHWVNATLGEIFDAFLALPQAEVVQA